MAIGRPGWRRALGAAVIAALAVAAASCGSDGAAAPSGPASAPAASSTPGTSRPAAARLPEPVQVLDIDGEDYRFAIEPDPASLRPGWTLLRFHNVGTEAHQVMFARVKDGVDPSELAAAGAGDASGAGAIDFVDMLGGVSYIDPTRTTSALVRLQEGAVMAMCYVPDARGVPHAFMGMTATLQVAADATPDAPDPLDQPVRGTIELSADGYQVPEDVPRGWYHVTNTDDHLHELSLLHLDRAVSADEAAAIVEDLAANRKPAVGLEAIGGLGAISPGFDGYLRLDLEPGQYLAVDFMPDGGDPRPHMLDGYYRAFTV